jgi:hypothetical protein
MSVTDCWLVKVRLYRSDGNRSGQVSRPSRGCYATCHPTSSQCICLAPVSSSLVSMEYSGRDFANVLKALSKVRLIRGRQRALPGV